VRVLRRELGLGDGRDPFFEGQYSPYGTIALFSSNFGPPQPDWPANVQVCGFPFLDEDFGGNSGLAPALAAFLDAGAPPIVFTLGSSAVNTAGDFYGQAAQAAVSMGRRAVLLAGASASAWNGLPAGILTARSAPYHLLFPRAAAIVHSGGAGTTGQALRTGRPQLLVPFSHDQFDNAERVKRLGAGGWVHRDRLTAAKLQRALSGLLEDPAVEPAAQRAAEVVRAENGIQSACDAIEAVLARRDP
jgi:rhamnosyltransferase subunit B